MKRKTAGRIVGGVDAAIFSTVSYLACTNDAYPILPFLAFFAADGVLDVITGKHHSLGLYTIRYLFNSDKAKKELKEMDATADKELEALKFYSCLEKIKNYFR